jgi:trans-2,3-dihydro-3-hydroxyanthranilate isomerase
MDVHYVTLDVFTDSVFGGNPLAVIPDGRVLSDSHMQSIANEFNLSETTFVLPPRDASHSHRVRIFTPVDELEFAGHPTLGTAVALALADADTQTSRTLLLEEGVGVVPVTVSDVSPGRAYAELSVAQLPVKRDSDLPLRAWAEALGLETGDVAADMVAPAHWSCGAQFAFVALGSLAALERAATNASDWTRSFGDSGSAGIFAFTFETGDDSVDVRARMFAPAHGIPEDPATGSAAAALAGALTEYQALSDGTHRWRVVQGVEMGRPSTLAVSADVAAGTLTAVRVGGFAVAVSRGTLTLP